MMRKRRATIAALTATALVGLAGPAASAATSTPAHHQKPKPTGSRISLSASANVTGLLQGDVVVFTFRATARKHPMGLEEFSYSKITGGQVVFFSCSYGNGNDQSAYADGHDCETLVAGTRTPAVYMVGVRTPWNTPLGTTVSATVYVDVDGTHFVSKTASVPVVWHP